MPGATRGTVVVLHGGTIPEAARCGACAGRWSPSPLGEALGSIEN